MNKNKLIFKIDKEYKNLLRKICYQTLKNFRGLPLVWEDLYNNFLIMVPELVVLYETSENTIDFSTFLSIKCKNISYNYCRGYNTNSHKIMNRSIFVENEKHFTSLSDSVKVEDKKVDLGIFNKKEFTFYQMYFLDGKKKRVISKKMKLSMYLVEKLKREIESKILLHIKN